MGFGKRWAAIVLGFLAVWIPLTILGLAWGSMYDWPDYVHVDYGFPVVWATHTLSTIAGPVDIWRVNTAGLLVDLVVWLGPMVTVVALVLRAFRKKG